jgi:hypothetical protein
LIGAKSLDVATLPLGYKDGLSVAAPGRVFAAFLPPKMIENFIESGVGRASVGDEAERQMSRNQIDKAVAEVREKGPCPSCRKTDPWG